MSPEDLLGEVARRLEGAGIPHMITGSFASSMLGLPRSTRDLDVVVGPEESQLDALAAAFPPRNGISILSWCATEIGVSDLLAKLRDGAPIGG